jgi:hypothetical protein
MFNYALCKMNIRQFKYLNRKFVMCTVSINDINGNYIQSNCAMTGQRFSPGTPVSSTNKTGHHDIAEILLKVALSTINQPTKF